MKHGTPFRAAQMMALTIASMAQTFGAGSALFREGLANLKYEGRGKGRARRHDNGGTAMAKRAATKARNVKRYRASLKG